MREVFLLIIAHFLAVWLPPSQAVTPIIAGSDTLILRDGSKAISSSPTHRGSSLAIYYLKHATKQRMCLIAFFSVARSADFDVVYLHADFDEDDNIEFTIEGDVEVR